MSENRFNDYTNPASVLWTFRDWESSGLTKDVVADALARIRELTPLPAVSEEAPADGDEQLYECTQPTCGCADDERYAPLPDPALPPPPVAEVSPGELRWLADVVDCYERLHRLTKKQPEPLTLPYSHFPARVVHVDGAWVLRIGGTVRRYITKWETE